MTRRIATRQLSETVLRTVYASDQDMYPVALHFSRVQSWVAACPDLCIHFVHVDDDDGGGDGDMDLRDSPSRGGCREDACTGTSTGTGTGTGTGTAVGGGSGRGSSSTSTAAQRGLLGVRFSEASGGVVGGVIIVLPLKKKAWEDVLCGKLKEPDIDAGSMFPTSGCGTGRRQGGLVEEEKGNAESKGRGEVEEIGLHVYHVERFDATVTPTGNQAERERAQSGWGSERKRFAEFALDEVMRRAAGKTGWKVVGLSALTATPAGKRTFERLGFVPTGYRELFVERPSQRLPGSTDKEAKGSVEMICLYPGQGYPNGEARPVADGYKVVSVSEMTVRYNT
ncbi:hypothetical protein VTK26DRAFT_9363 [Humicola hyalothermophila]